MSCSFGGIKRKDRQYPLNQPDGWKIKYPRWTLQLPADINKISVAYVGIQSIQGSGDGNVFNTLHKHTVIEAQRKVASLIEERILGSSGMSTPEEWEKLYVESGYDIPDTENIRLLLDQSGRRSGCFAKIRPSEPIPITTIRKRIRNWFVD